MGNDLDIFTYGSLCTGIGGLDRVFRWLGWRAAFYCEIDLYCQQVLQARIRDRLLDDAPIWDDLTTFNGNPWRGLVDAIITGDPCQAHSIAGKREGAGSAKDLWPEVRRIISEIRPSVVFRENPLGSKRDTFHRIIPDLQRMGYTCPPPVITAAAEVGAGHIRKRIFLLAYSNTERLERLYQKRGGIYLQSAFLPLSPLQIWQTEPSMDRVLDGISLGVARPQLEAYGNAVVSQQALLAWRLLTCRIGAET